MAEFRALPESQRARYKIVKGHMYFGLHKSFPGRTAYITFLRHPIDRILSHYTYVQRRTDHYLHERFMREKPSLSEYVTGGYAKELSNGMTRNLAGLGSEQKWEGPDDQLLQTAKKHIEDHFLFAGLLEQFDEGLVILSDLLGWRTPFYRIRNVSDAQLKAPLDRDVEKAIRSSNSLDLSLYEWVKERYEHLKESYEGNLQRDVQRFMRSNSGVGIAAYYFHRILTRYGLR
jgi:hypothetical protein